MNCTNGLIGREIHQTFDAFEVTCPEQAEAKAIAQDYANGDGGRPWLVLDGNTGTGKDHLASAVCHVFSARGDRVFAESLFGVSAYYRSMAYDGKGSEWDALEYFDSLDLLVLRDVGVKQIQGAELATVIELLDRRARLQKSLIITTNIGLAGLHELLTARVTDRMCELAYTGKAVICNWPSFRRRA